MSARQKIIGSVLLIGLFVVFLWGGNSEKNPLETKAETTTENAPAVLVELFTSQGCSSCPPADQVLKRLIDEEEGTNVIGLSYHVDYWNRLGWNDPYSKAEFSDRQRQYAQVLPDHRVYTPQMVIQGQSGHVGSREREVTTAIQKISKQAAAVTISSSASWDHQQAAVKVEYQLSGPLDDVVLNIAIIEKTLGNKVPRGENGGRTLTHVNVVRQLTTVDDPSTTGTQDVQLEEGLTEIENLDVIVFVQHQASMAIHGVAVANFNHR